MMHWCMVLKPWRSLISRVMTGLTKTTWQVFAVWQSQSYFQDTQLLCLIACLCGALLT